MFKTMMRLFQIFVYVCCVQFEILYFSNRQWVINLASGSEYERGNVGIEFNVCGKTCTQNVCC